MTGHTVVGDRVVLNVGYYAARTQLRILARGGMLPRASEVAYGEGITTLVELAGPAAGLTRLADVCLEDLTETDDCAHVALQWEAIGADGKLFTALLADLMLVPAGDHTTALSLAGAYWPPPGRAGTGLGQVIARCCATTVIGSFLDSVACELVHLPAPPAAREKFALRPVREKQQFFRIWRSWCMFRALMHACGHGSEAGGGQCTGGGHETDTRRGPRPGQPAR